MDSPHKTRKRNVCVYVCAGGCGPGKPLVMETNVQYPKSLTLWGYFLVPLKKRAYESY